MKTKLTPFSKLLIVIVVVGALAWAAIHFNLIKLDKLNSGTDENDSTENVDFGDAKVLRVGVVTWGGYAGGQYFNRGFKPNKESQFFKDYGFLVEFIVLDDFNPSRDAWKSDKVDLLWTTIDAFTTEVAGLWEYKPQVIMQSDWSRGGDAIVVRKGINTAGDLKGKKVAFAEMTPSHTFLLWVLEAANLKYSDIEPVIVESAFKAAELFKAGSVDAAVVWSPDDADCVAAVDGSKILQNTKDASNIIADVFIVKEAFLNSNKEMLTQFVEGWMKGAAEINTSEAAKKEAAKILSDGFDNVFDETFCINAINNVRLCTFGDNRAFFGLDPNYKGLTGKDIYTKMEAKFREIGYIEGRIPGYDQVANSSIIEAINLTGDQHLAEEAKTFVAPTEEATTSEAISTKAVTITFQSGTSALDDNMKYIIDKEFLDIARSFANLRIRIEGNTDDKGNRQSNIDLSRKRAQAVADYLIAEHGFDKNRFVIVGNGPDKPIAENSTEDGRSKNRRTEFQLIRE